MTVQTDTTVATGVCNGVTTVFPINYKFNHADDLVVTVIEDETGDEKVLTLESDYTVQGAGEDLGGSITMLSAPPTGFQIRIERILRVNQTTDLRNQGKFFAEVHEDTFDRIVMFVQQAMSGLSQASYDLLGTVRSPTRETMLPMPRAFQRSGKLLSFDAFGNPVAVAPVSDSSTELRMELASPDGASMSGTPAGKSPAAPAIVWSLQKELDGGVFNVRRMGAKPSSIFDSTDAFLRAQEECAFLGGKALRVPGGAEPYNIESSILNPSQGHTGIGLQGEGIGITRLRWAGGAGRLIDAFNGWQYGFSLSGFTLESLATGKDDIVSGSVGLHIERSQTEALIHSILVKGFDLNIDVGVHSQFIHWLMVQSREGNTLLNSYGQNADMNVWDNCRFYAGRYRGALVSSPRTIFRDCWFGPTNAFSEPDYVDVTIGYQAIRPEDVGKSSSTQPGALGHSGQHGALVRPRFERGNAALHTAPYIVFRDIDPRSSTTTLSPFLLDNPIMPNHGPTHAIEVADRRRGLRIIAPEANDDISVLIRDTPPSDGSIQYIEVTENYFPRLFEGQRSYMTKGRGYFIAGDGVETNASATLVPGGDTTIQEYPETGAMRAVKGVGAATTLLYFSRPTSQLDARFFIKAAPGSIGSVTISCYTPGPDYLFRMRDIPADVLVGGVSIVLPGTSGGPVTLAISVPPSAPGEIVFEQLLYAA